VLWFVNYELWTDMDLLPRSEAEHRVSRLQARMSETSLDAVFVYQNADLFYFSGTVQAGLFCLPPSGEPLYLVQKSVTRARNESPWARVIGMPNPKKAPDLLAAEGMTALGRVGLELDVLPANHLFRLQRLFPATEFVDVSDAIRTIRMIKSPYEVAQIRRAAKMLAQAFEKIPGWLRPGIREIELASRLEGFLRKQRHQGLVRMRSFNGEMGYGALSGGPSASYPTCFAGPVGFVGLYPAIPNGAGERPLASGDTLMADIVGGYGGYIADKTRTFGLPPIAPDFGKAHGFVLDLMADIEASLKPGVICEDIYSRCLARIEKSPYGEGFMGLGDSRVRFLGHGVGLELDELPVLAPGFTMALEPGMTIAVEPKIFFPGRGGVGIENTYLITESGCENLTDYPEEILTAEVG
jgi:Xaa-Pro aminopeptidase